MFAVIRVFGKLPPESKIIVLVAVAVIIGIIWFNSGDTPPISLPVGYSSAQEVVASEDEREPKPIPMGNDGFVDGKVYDTDMPTPGPDQGACGNPYLPSFALCAEDAQQDN